jgi:hypothetical protein
MLGINYKKYVLLITVGVAICISTVLLSQFVQIFQAAFSVHPYLGYLLLASFLIIITCCFGYPIYSILRLPKNPLPPERADSSEYGRYLEYDANIDFTENLDGIHASFKVLNAKADKIINDTAKSVCISTAISQYGRLDTLLVLVAQIRMIWQVACIYSTRPQWNELVSLYTNVLMASLIAGGVEESNIESQIEVIVNTSLGHGLAGIPGISGVSAFFVKSLLTGSINAFLTLRTGIIAKRYCSALTQIDKQSVRRYAFSEASVMVGGLVLGTGKKIAASIAKRLVKTGVDNIASGVKATQESVVSGAGKVGGAVASGFEITGDIVASGANLAGSTVVKGTRETGKVISTGADLTKKMVGKAGEEITSIAQSAKIKASNILLGEKKKNN